MMVDYLVRHYKEKVTAIVADLVKEKTNLKSLIPKALNIMTLNRTGLATINVRFVCMIHIN